MVLLTLTLITEHEKTAIGRQTFSKNLLFICAETSLESRADFQSCLTDILFCFLNWSLRSNQQLSFKIMPINIKITQSITRIK